jgi:tetratricopeptide (TPR) repeat protein
MQVAQSLDPVSAIIARDLTMVHYYRRDFDAALEQCDHSIEVNPHFSPTYWALGLIQEQRKDFDESAAAFQRAVQLSPQSPKMHGALGRTFALSGQRPMALRILKKLRELSRHRYVSPCEFAWIHFALGESDPGFRWLFKACEARYFDLIGINVDPRFDALKSDRRFADDPAIVGGFGTFEGTPALVIGHQKGRSTKEKVRRNFGQPKPEGYRKALRLMELAARMKRPIICLIDTQGAYPGLDAEERGQAEAIAKNLEVMAGLPVPIVCASGLCASTTLGW